MKKRSGQIKNIRSLQRKRLLAACGLGIALSAHGIASAAERPRIVLLDTQPAASASFSEATGEVYVNADTVNIRTAPSTSAAVIETVARGRHFTRTGVGQDASGMNWTRIRYANGAECYVASSYLSETAPAETVPAESAAPSQADSGDSANASSGGGSGSASSALPAGEIGLDMSWPYAGESLIHTGAARLYKADASIAKGKTVCVNAGHGTQGGASVKTFCHPDHTPKVTGGSTGAGELKAAAVSTGTQMLDGTAEARVNLQLALLLKEKLLAAGYNVLMIRESDDVQLDNIARTVIANNCADCHLALHYDSTTNNKGAFFMSVPEIASYKAMEPVASHWQQHNQLGRSVIQGMQATGVKIYSNGEIGMDLTQTSYSTVPSIDLELGDRGSDWSVGTQSVIASGIVAGVNIFFGF